ncbi:MAG: molybdopterin converting factor subunit 1 [Methylococcales bacterium]|jgi:molybdopterin synthase sulfur carrier subunit|nr:molybdopterin converting factor subunit 1 [Methylococcaceae bacterium]
MSIKVRYFASLKERIGRAEDQVEFTMNVTVSDIWQQVNQDKALPENILAAVNMEYVGFDHPVNDGDEVAFFPPVTGG